MLYGKKDSMERCFMSMRMYKLGMGLIAFFLCCATAVASNKCDINETGDSWIDCGCTYNYTVNTTGIIHIRSYNVTNGVTQLHADTENLFSPLGWTRVGTTTFVDALLTQDGDTKYAKFTPPGFGRWSPLTMTGYEDLLEGTNPPPDEDVTLNSVRVYGIARLVAGGFPYSGKLGISITGWSGFLWTNSLSGGYSNQLYASYGTTGKTVDDINNIQTRSIFSAFTNINHGRITEQYVNVSWSRPNDEVIFYEGFKAKGYDIVLENSTRCKFWYKWKEIEVQ